MTRLSLCATAWLTLVGTAFADEAPSPPASDASKPEAAPPPADAPAPEQTAGPESARAPDVTGDVERDKPAVTAGSYGEVMRDSGSVRGVAEEFFVLPSGIDVGGRLRTVMADGGLGTGKLKLTDLAFFDLAAQWAIAKHYELDVSATVLPKQPSATSEHLFQGGSVTLRRDLVRHTALALAGSAGPLLGIKGLTYGGSLFLEHKHRLNELVTFALAGGAISTVVRPKGMFDHPLLVEGAGHASLLVRIPNGVWGGWMGVGYAVPAYHRGHDPISGMRLDPQPRLDLDIGNAVQLADQWDLSVDLTIIDRGDLSNPATRLPILDGGFDQVQLMVGISRRIKRGEQQRGITDPLIQL